MSDYEIPGYPLDPGRSEGVYEECGICGAFVLAQAAGGKHQAWHREMEGTPPVSGPSGLQLDLASALARMAQCKQHSGSVLLISRLLTCDLPRLMKYLTPETVAWMDQNEPGWREGA